MDEGVRGCGNIIVQSEENQDLRPNVRRVVPRVGVGMDFQRW